MVEGAISPRVAGVVLAAGRSDRMGQDKALLDAEGHPFVARAVRCLAGGGARPVIVVTRTPDGAVARAAREAGARVAANPDPDHPVRGGPVSSVRRALGALATEAGDIDGLLVLPVDHPRVRPDSVRALVETFDADRTHVVVPAWNGRRGHPVLIARALFDELARDDLAQGLRTVVHRHREARVVVEVDDPGVVDDLDTPAEYRAAFRSDPTPVAGPGTP